MSNASSSKFPGSEIQVAHWAHPHRPVEGELVAFFHIRGLRPTRWSNPAGDIFSVHAHTYRKTVFCLEGSIIFSLPDLRREIELFPGDRLILPPGTRHGATVGPEGVTCIEAGK